MSSAYTRLINACRETLVQIIDDLEKTEYGIRYDFSGIGQEACGDCVKDVREEYKAILRMMGD